MAVERIKRHTVRTRKGDRMMNLFISYAHEDEVFRVEIEKFLVMLSRQKLINIWSDRKIGPGSDWDHEINDNLRKSKVILLLVSQDFLNSDYCYDIEMKFALERHLNNDAVVIPIIIRPCDWKNTTLKDIEMLPQDAKPITLWDNQDLAFLNVSHGIRSVINKIANREQIVEPFMFSGVCTGVFNQKAEKGAPYIKNNRTYMSVKYLAHMLGVNNDNILWDKTENTMSLLKDYIVIQIKVGSNRMLINGTEIKMDVATEFENGEVMLPPNFIAQAFGAKVYWDNNYSSLMIEKWS